MQYKGIILSGLPRAGKSVLSRRLSEHYGWEMLYIGKMWRDRWKAEHPDGKVSFEDYWRGTSIEDNRQININAKKIIKKDSLVVDSRYSAFYCKDVPYLRVFLDADLEVRAERARRRERKEEKESGKKARTLYELKKLMQQRELDEVQTGQDIFGDDFRDRRHYHIVLDTGRLTINQEYYCLRALIDNS